MDKLNINSIQIGDWVLDGNHIAQIVLFTCDGIIGTTFNESSNIDVIEPIPLTPEILEKNGFKCHAHPNYICDSYFIDGISLLDFRSGYFKYVTITLEYVHQLQHLLKLCNIDKEIEL